MRFKCSLIFPCSVSNLITFEENCKNTICEIMVGIREEERRKRLTGGAQLTLQLAFCSHSSQMTYISCINLSCQISQCN